MLLLLKMSRGDAKLFLWIEEDGGLCVCWLLMKFEVCLYVRVCNEIYNRVDECPLHVRYARIGGAGK